MTWCQVWPILQAMGSDVVPFDPSWPTYFVPPHPLQVLERFKARVADCNDLVPSMANHPVPNTPCRLNPIPHSLSAHGRCSSVSRPVWGAC
jgi:hypothetical protein